MIVKYTSQLCNSSQALQQYIIVPKLRIVPSVLLQAAPQRADMHDIVFNSIHVPSNSRKEKRKIRHEPRQNISEFALNKKSGSAED